MAIPNFLIIGDIKAGSTSLYHYLKQHPDVYMPSDLKELRYFSYDKNNAYHVRAKSTRVRTYGEYQGHFDKYSNEKAIGEASPSYLRSPIAAKKIKEKIPNVKIIACLRNPADRLYSLYQMKYRAGQTEKTFDELCFCDNAAWIKANYYWGDLKRFYDAFDESQIKIIIFDELATDTEKTVKDLYQFLHIDDTYTPNISVQNKGGMPKNQYHYTLLVSLRNHLKRFISPSARIKAVWENLKRKSLTKEIIDPKIKEQILEICKDDIFRTKELVKRDLSIWFE